MVDDSEGGLSRFEVRRVAQAGRAGFDDALPCSMCSVRNLTICAALDTGELHALADIVTNSQLDPGATLFEEGQAAESVFNVTSGTVKVYKLMPDGRRQVTGFLTTGDFLGLVSEGAYAYNAEAVTRTWLCRFPRAKLDGLLDRYPKMERRLLAAAGHELAAAQEQMLLLGRKSALEKIASFLFRMSERARNRGLKANPITLAMTRHDMADYLGLTTETVSRIFTQLRGRDLIALQPGGKLEILDMAALSHLAKGE